MTETTIEETARVNITFDLKDFIGHYYGDDQEPMRNYLGQQAAELIVKDIRDDVRKAVATRIEAQVAAIVTEAIEAGVQTTNTWGEPTGKRITLRDAIVAQVNDFLTKESGDYNRRETKVQKFLREVVDREIQKELKAAVDQAKAEVVARVKDQAAQVIADTVARMGGVR